MSHPIPPQIRGRAVLTSLILISPHAVFIAPAHHGSSHGQLMVVGAYCGALAAFIAALALGASVHQRAPIPNARLGQVFIAGWLTAVWGSAVGALVGLVAAVTGESPVQRIYGAALVGPGLAALFATRFALSALVALAAKEGPKPPMEWGKARLQLGLAAAGASALFGALHPFVRFPLGVSKEGDVVPYAATAVGMVAVLLPLAGWRLMRATISSGAVLPGVHHRGLAVFNLLVLGAAVLGSIIITAPKDVATWSVARAITGALLGPVAVLCGAAFTTPRGSGRSALPGKASRPRP